MVTITVFRTVEINRKLATIWRVFIEENKKQLKIHKNSKICSVLTCSITISSPQLQVILKTYSLTIRVAVKTRSLAFTGMGSGELPQKPHSQGIVIIRFVWQLTGKSSLAELVFLWSDWLIQWKKSLFPRAFDSSQLLNNTAALGASNNWANKRLTKKLNRKSWEIRHTGKLWYILGNLCPPSQKKNPKRP